MKIGLLAVNAKYIHSNLALRYLRQRFNEPSLFSFFEYSINEAVDQAYREIYATDIEAIIVSVYIWNREWVSHLMADLALVRPELKIFIGGPEAESSPEPQNHFPWATGILNGDIDAITNIEAFEALIIYGQGRIEIGEGDIEGLPFPYTDAELHGKVMLYYEAERGCPYRCSFCRASEDVRKGRKSFAKVSAELSRFIAAGVKQVKFVDRSFNTDDAWCCSILDFVNQNAPAETCFHFEIAPHLMTKRFIDCVKASQPGQFQFEIGIQSMNPETLAAIRRNQSLVKSLENLGKLIDTGKSHVHVDLIAGLPQETLSSFIAGFNRLIQLKPHMIQLGFLKVLDGTHMALTKAQYGILHRDYAPYEVLQTTSMTASELNQLKSVEDLVERYYNSHRFEHVLRYAMEVFDGDVYRLFLAISELPKLKQQKGQYPPELLYEALLDLAEISAADAKVLRTLVLFDYLSHYAGATSFYTPHLEPLQSEHHEQLRTQQYRLGIPVTEDPLGLPVKVLLKKGQCIRLDLDIEAYINTGQIIMHRGLYFVKRSKNAKHGLPEYGVIRLDSEQQEGNR